MGFGGQNPAVTINYGGGAGNWPWGGNPTGPGMGGGAAIPVSGSQQLPTVHVTASVIPYLLEKVYQATGRRFSLKSILTVIRRMSRIMAPLSIAAALGLAAEEMGDIILAGATRRRRRMNSLNPRALDRAMRRVCSFNRRVTKAKAMMGTTATYRRKKRSCK